MAHHSPHAGYDRIAAYVPSTLQVPNGLYRLLSHMPERLLAQIRKSAGAWYNSTALLQEVQAAFHMLVRHSTIYHFLYGEDGFHYAGYWKIRSSNCIVATFHMPPEKFRMIMPKTYHLKRLDAVVIVAPNQEEVFKNLVPPERVHLIPHGIDTDFFTPGDKNTLRKRLCLCVGSHLRDFYMLRKVIDTLARHDSSISFCIVTIKKLRHLVDGLPSTTVLEAISEAHLLSLYRTASVLILPLLDATSNNALLEALACGLPVVATDTGGIRLYGNGGGVMFVPPGDHTLMARETLRILDDPQHWQALSQAARTNAEQFDWVKVAAQMCRLYEQLG